MIKAEINLLPPAVKRERLSRLVRHQVSRLYWWVVLITTVTTVALGVSWWVLQQINQRLQTAAAQPSGQTKEAASVRSLNQLLGALQSRVGATQPWVPMVTAVLGVMPPDLQLTTLTVPAGTQHLVIEGTSANRAAVADLEQRLKGLAWVETVAAPLTNLVVDREGTFSFTVARKTVLP